LLFALESRAGTLTPEARAGKGHFELTLRGVERRATWFTDRPSETPGESTRASHFAPGRRLGFRASPPNAALVVDRAKSSADTIAIELRLRSYDKRRRSARFAVRTLGSLGGGLRHINRHIAHRLPHASLTPPSSSTTPALRRSAGPVPPKLTAPAAGAEYFITTNGAWPLSFGY
jgi:hypothetical protein